MKKLIASASLILMATFAHSAVCQWGMNGLTADPTGATAVGLKVYLLDSATANYVDTLAAFTSGDFSALTSYIVSGDLVAQGETNARLKTFEFGDYTAGDSYTYYSVVVNDDQSYFYATKEKTQVVPQNGNLDMTFGNASTGDYAGAWTAVNVPEPTSGLLLLCGLAGLALRRKRA